MKFPRGTKFLKEQKGRAFNKIKPVFMLNKLKVGVVGLKAIESGRVSSRQMEAFFQCLNKLIKKAGRVKLNFFPQTPITKKPIEVRMGKGKGNVELWVSKVRVGAVLCEISIGNPILGLKALVIARQKLTLKTKIF